MNNHRGYYNRVGGGGTGNNNNNIMMRRCNGFRGFRLNPRRFSVQKLRSKLLFLLKIFNRFRSSLRSMKRNMRRSNSSRRSLVMAAAQNIDQIQKPDYRLRYYGRSNSFYSEAIADCLDFIKRNSLSVDDDQKPVLINSR